MAPKIDIVFEHLSRVRPHPGEQRRPARAAQRELAIHPVEAHSAARQGVNVRRLCQRMAVATEGVVQVVRHQEQDILWPLLSGETKEKGTACQHHK